jgi:hypothetical protein
MRNMMKAADTMDVSNAAEAGMDGTGTVEAGMHAVSAAMTTAMSAAMTAAMSAAVPAATPASGRDGRGESRRNERAWRRRQRWPLFEAWCCLLVGHPPAAMLMPAADAGLNAGSRLREPAVYGGCRRRCRGGVRSV